MRSTAVAALIFILAPASVHAGPFCDQLQSASTEKQGAYILLIVEEMLKDWPQHAQMKRSTSDAERLRMFADTQKKLVSECATGKDFAAGMALGEGLALDKKSLLEVWGIPENTPE